MRPSRRIAAVAALCTAAMAFATQAAPPAPLEQRLSAEQLHATGLDTLTPQQLALLDRLLAEEQARAADAAGVAPPAAVAQSNTTAPGPPQPSLFAGQQDGPFQGRLVGGIGGWAPGTVFTLEDGQQWQVLKGQLRLPRTRQSPHVVLVPGVMGRWFLQVDEDLPKARVQRIR
jgi:hypothetical protein